MRLRVLTLLAALGFLASLAQAAPPASYYLALGDSLAVGLQPTAKGDVPTNQGYVDDLYAILRPLRPGLFLAKLGCSGETTGTMITGGVCYPQGEGQLQAAVTFLQSHRVSLITIDLGANDVDQCFDVSTLSINVPCVQENLSLIPSNLAYILGTLHQASPSTPIIAMNYYDPFLAAWKLLPGAEGQPLAIESLQLTNGAMGIPGLNEILESVYGAYGVPVADVASAFKITDFSDVPLIRLPVNVFLTLSLTWMAAPPPLGPDIHPNAAGYATIAAAFVEKIARR